jgi:UDP-3-O-[3-hydroxymyristoyl] glucosamine N-acyltransferase
MTLRELAEQLGCRLEGDGSLDIVRVAGLQDAGPGDITFLANNKYAGALAATRASAVILRDEAPQAPCAVLRAADPYLAFARAVGLFTPAPEPPPGVHPLALVSPAATLGRDVSIS